MSDQWQEIWADMDDDPEGSSENIWESSVPEWACDNYKDWDHDDNNCSECALRREMLQSPASTPTNLESYLGLVDGGYLTFVYGSRTGGNWGGWDQARFHFLKYLFVMDSPKNVRKDYFDEYKAGRKERRQKREYQQKIYEQVMKFRSLVLNDPLVRTVSIEGYEADDLVAYLFLKGIGTEHVVAQDKDLFMVPGIHGAMTDHNGVPARAGLKLPKYAMAVANHKLPAMRALNQALFGDKSDSIPRLLPSVGSHAKAIYQRLVWAAPDTSVAYINCYKKYGGDFIRNFFLVLLPHPTMRNDVDELDDPYCLMDLLATGSYWDPKAFRDQYLDEVTQCLEARPVW